MELDVSLQAGRWSIFQGIHESIIIDSSYNASPGSVKHILMETTEWLHTTHATYQPIFILGEMRELGTQNEKEHTGLAEFLVPYVQAGIPLFLVGDAMVQIVEPWLQAALSQSGDGRESNTNRSGTSSGRNERNGEKHTEKHLVRTFPNYAAL